MTQNFKATAFLAEPKGTSRWADLTLEAGGLRVRSGRQTALWPYGSLRLSPAGDENQYLLVTSSSGGPFDSLVAREPAFFKALGDRLPSQRDLLHGFDSSRKAARARKWLGLVGSVLVGLFLLALAWWGVTRWLVKEVVKHTPVPVEVRWGDRLAAGYLRGKRELRKGPAVDAAQKIWKRLTDAAKKDNPGYPLILHVVEDPTVNAFALPGGHVILLTGLMRNADSADEVAGVLAHETQHVLRRHVTSRIAQSLGSRLLVSTVFGGSDLEGLTLTAEQLGELSYGRSQETEADLEGAKLMARAGLPPSSLGTFMKKLEEVENPGSKFPALLSTHPQSAERAKRLAALAKTLKVVDPRPLGIDWTLVKESLK